MMTHTLTLVTPPEAAPMAPSLLPQLQAVCMSEAVVWLDETTRRACDLPGITEPQRCRDELVAMLEELPVDWCLQPEQARRKQLLISDMDSTIIGQECIDEIAVVAGIGEAIAEITERAMRGELDFTASLRERVALLAGLEEALLEDVWRERIRLNPGAEALVRTMNAHGARTLLVSGGFTFFSGRVAEAAGFQHHHANRLESEGGQLTGAVLHPVLDQDTKARLLTEECTALALDASATLAVGDGANDAAMLQAAGLGVAYHAKPALQSVADAVINHNDLTTLLYFQGYRSDASGIFTPRPV